MSGWSTEAIQFEMSKILGAPYGGPSLSYDKETKRWIIYRWQDAPIDMDVIAQGVSLEDVVKKYLTKMSGRNKKR